MEVVSVAREPGKLSKIIVKPLSEGLDAVHCFVSEYQNGTLRTALGEEILNVSPWHDDPKEMIATVLLYFKKDKISQIKLDNNKRLARVSIPDKDARNLAVGSNGINVKLTSIVTGWNIDIRKD